ncbi:MAG: iron chelate uptake ABC transporter family permease subunit [Sarcina sp.]
MKLAVKSKENTALLIISILTVVASILFLTMGISKGNLQYALGQRIPRLIAIVITGAAIGVSTVIFQTITNNRIITANVLGLDSLYVLIQTVMLFVFGGSSFFISNKLVNFAITVITMVLASMLFYKFLFKSGKINMVYLVLIGMIVGTLFSSLSSFLQMIIDPNEYLILQGKLFASFNNIKTDLLIFSVIALIAVVPFIWDDIKYLDILSLGRDQAINLGIDYKKVVKKFLIVIAIFTSVSTALVGPITFLGLLVANLAKEIIKGYKHKNLIMMTILISIFTLVFGEVLLGKILLLTAPVTVIINLIGGTYFIYLLLKENKI